MLKKETIISLILFTCLYVPFAVFFYQEGLSKGMNLHGFIAAVFVSGKFGIFLRSVCIALLSSTLTLIAGFLVSFSILKTNLKYARFFVSLFLLPMAIPPFVYIEGLLFISQITGKNLFSQANMIGMFCIVYMPISAIILGSGFLSIPRSIEESAVLSFPGNQWFFKITLPWMKPYIISAFLISFLFIFSNYEIPSLMNVQTYTLLVFNQFGAFYNNLEALYLLLPVFILFVAIVIGEKLVVGNRSFFQLSFATTRQRCELPKLSRIALYIFLLLLSIPVLLPFVIIVFKASGIKSINELVRPYWKEVGYSFVISAGAGAVTIVIASVFVRSMVLFSKRLRSTFSILALLPFAIPPALIAFGLIQFSGKISGSSPVVGSLILIAGLSARYFPIIVYILYAHALTINPHLADAAQLHCGSWFSNICRIWLPLSWGVIKKAFFFFILLSIAEIGLAVLLVPPDCMTASVNIYSMLHYGFEKEVAVETLLLMTIAVALGYFILREKPKQFSGNVS